MAEALLYYGDPELPSQPRRAFLTVIHKVQGAFSDDSDQAVVADAQLVCNGLDHHQSADQVITSLTSRQLTEFEADLVAISASEYFCPQDDLQAEGRSGHPQPGPLTGGTPGSRACWRAWWRFAAWVGPCPAVATVAEPVKRPEQA